MPTTVRPAAHDESMASRAVTPSSDAPYPTLVGTATTGAGVSPPTRLASAPSMPATTMTASAAASWSVAASSRCRPATPTSATSVGSRPWARSVATHSSATGRSAVPAVSTSTFPGRGRRDRQASVVPVRTAPGLLASHAFTWSSVARVSRTGADPSSVRSSATMAAHCSAVLPGA